MLSDELALLNEVRTGIRKMLCCVCNQKAVVMRREIISDGSEMGSDPKTGAPMRFAKFKPGEMKWYCRAHAPAAAVPNAAFEPTGRESR